MSKTLDALYELKKGNLSVLKDKCLMYIYLTNEQKINYERINSLKNISKNPVLDYVIKTLEILDQEETIDVRISSIIEEVLKWSEVAKCGLPHQRNEWLNKGIDLFVHNIGSAEIYKLNNINKTCSFNELINHECIYLLIKTHGLIGQFLRGETELKESIELRESEFFNIFNEKEKFQLLYVLNKCIIKAISEDLWYSIKNKVTTAIDNLLLEEPIKKYDIYSRIGLLRNSSTNDNKMIIEEFKEIINTNVQTDIESIFKYLFNKASFWYVETALKDFNITEFTKIFLLIFSSKNIMQFKHISFESFMKEIYYDHKNEKTINIYKKRIIEKYLSEMSFEDIINGNIKPNKHVNFNINIGGYFNETAIINFKFSKASEKLIEFCTASEQYDLLYEKAIIMLYDLFGFRRDKEDRFYNEDDYLQTMNGSINQKKVILDYIKGNNILDVGPGGGALMDYICEAYPDKKVHGIDIANNVVEILNNEMKTKSKKWASIIQGNGCEINKYIPKELNIDTIIFSSVIHHFYSYVNTDGKLFNIKSVENALKNSFEILPIGGRIIIRDGVKTEPENQYRIIRFRDNKGMEFLKRYSLDFEGRKIQYKVLNDNEVKMPINDAMEFLYTYTWGEDSYALEVAEQFGYFNPTEYKECITRLFGDKAEIKAINHYLQDGYDIHLLKKIEFFDENYKAVSLPDSTIVIVIEKLQM